MERQRVYFIGDGGYPCLPFMRTPLRNPQTRAEHRYNMGYARTLGIMERTFGVLKKRFPCLQQIIRSKLQNTLVIIVAVFVLHNLLRQRGDADESEDDSDDEDDDYDNDDEIRIAIVRGDAVRRTL